jgi:hypothetical protein
MPFCGQTQSTAVPISDNLHRTFTSSTIDPNNGSEAGSDFFASQQPLRSSIWSGSPHARNCYGSPPLQSMTTSQFPTALSLTPWYDCTSNPEGPYGDHLSQTMYSTNLGRNSLQYHNTATALGRTPSSYDMGIAPEQTPSYSNMDIALEQTSPYYTTANSAGQPSSGYTMANAPGQTSYCYPNTATSPGQFGYDYTSSAQNFGSFRNCGSRALDEKAPKVPKRTLSDPFQLFMKLKAWTKLLSKRNPFPKRQV